MHLVDHWVIGFSGKRQLSNPGGVRVTMRRVLEELRNFTDGQLVAMSSAAIGADLLFATDATALAIPWICVLPSPEAAFFNERDVQMRRSEMLLKPKCVKPRSMKS